MLTQSHFTRMNWSACPHQLCKWWFNNKSCLLFCKLIDHKDIHQRKAKYIFFSLKKNHDQITNQRVCPERVHRPPSGRDFKNLQLSSFDCFLDGVQMTTKVSLNLITVGLGIKFNCKFNLIKHRNRSHLKKTPLNFCTSLKFRWIVVNLHQT